MFASASDGTVRRAEPDEAAAITDVWLRSRRAAAPTVPPPAHTDAEIRGWFRDVVLPNLEVWVIGPRSRPVAMMVINGNWIEQLYVAPDRQRQGHGSRLIRFAQRRRRELRLRTFESNRPARAFYEAHGFHTSGPPDSDNEEHTPALVYRWSRAG